MLGILMLGATITAFFIALFRNDKRKMFVSLVFTCIAVTTLLVLLTSIDALLYVICIVAMPVIIAVMLIGKGKAVPWVCWVVAFLFIGLALCGFFASWDRMFYSSRNYFWDYFKNTFDDIEECWYYFTHDGMFTDSTISMNVNNFYRTVIDLLSTGFWEIPDSTVLVFALISTLPFIVFLGFMIGATVMRNRRMKALSTDGANGDSDGLSTGYYTRVRHDGCAKAGNILSSVSYITMLAGVRLLYPEDYYIPLGVSIACIAVSLICGFIAWLLLRYAIEYGYEMSAITKAIYIWSWIPAIIVIAIVIVTMLIVCACGGTDFSSVANKRVYKVIDENGEVRVLDYDGKDIYAKCKDDKGEWWETSDGGSTFRKCDLYKIKDDLGRDKYIRDVSGGGKRIFTDGKGGTYESDDGGITVTEQKD